MDMGMGIHMHTSVDQLLSLCYLSSPALPIGAFAYSQGLESAIEDGIVTDRLTLSSWVSDIMTHGLAQLDFPLLLRFREIVKDNDLDAYAAWTEITLALRESDELVQEELNLGASLARLLKTQDALITPAVSAFTQLPKHCYLGAFAIASHSLALDEDVALLSFCWSWLENQVAVACKAIPLGQTHAQQILLENKKVIPQLLDGVVAAQSADSLRGSLPGLAFLSAKHETQYSRLFRS